MTDAQTPGEGSAFTEDGASLFNWGGFQSSVTARPGFDRVERIDVETLLRQWEQDWLAQTGVNLIVDESLKRGFEVKISEQPDKTTLNRFNELNYDPFTPDGILAHALCLGRAAGGAAIVMLPDRGGAESYVKPRAANDGVRRLVWCRYTHMRIAEKQTDPNARDYGLPTVYYVTKPGVFLDLPVHASRVLLCEGSPRRDANVNQPWISVLEPAYTTLQNYGMSWEAISYLLHEYSLLVLSMRGVHGALGTGKDTVAKQRMAAMSRGKSMFKTLFLDSEGGEKAERLNASFSDMPQLMQEMSRQLSGCFKMPLTKLLGISPAGMNATGESDTRQWYDSCASYQCKNIEPKLKIILGAISGKDVDIKWPSLWVPTANESADLRQKLLAGDKLLWEMEVLSPLQLFVSRAQDGTLGIDVDPLVLEDYKKRLAAGETEIPGLEKQQQPTGNPLMDPNGPTGTTDDQNGEGATGGQSGQAPDDTGNAGA